MKKTRYYALFSANYGTTFCREPYEFTNKAKAIKDIREIAEGQTGGLENCYWFVKDDKGNEVAEGCRINGMRIRIK